MLSANYDTIKIEIELKGSGIYLEKREKVLVLIGPTAVGKTKLSIELAKRFNGEIISGDSMQIYKGMDIGTAKITEEEMNGIPHHLIDIKYPEEAFSVAEFQQLVRTKITEILAKGKLPMIVGGTGLYIQAVLYDYPFSDLPIDLQYRALLEKQAEEKGNEFIHQQLQQVDPGLADKLHPNNVRRVIRALEIFHCTGKTMSELQEEQKPELVYEAAIIGLNMDREQLYNRINKRVDMMLSEGLLEEVQTLYNAGIKDSQSMQGIGYKEIVDYIEGNCTLEDAIDKLKQNSRRYAKRQLTWFRNKLPVKWFDMTNVSNVASLQKKIMEISDYIEGKLTIKANT